MIRVALDLDISSLFWQWTKLVEVFFMNKANVAMYVECSYIMEQGLIQMRRTKIEQVRQSKRERDWTKKREERESEQVRQKGKKKVRKGETE